MPLHDWTRVDAGIFHAFHHNWITEISRTLNNGVLSADYYALPEQFAGRFGPDVLTLKHPGGEFQNVGPMEAIPQGSIALATAPSAVRFRLGTEANRYAAKAKSVVVRHVSRHQVVAMIEILSPGNKNNRSGLDAFVRKSQEALAAGIHLLLIDLFPPGPRDRQGIHGAIWGDDGADPFVLPEDKPSTCVAYVGGSAAEASLEPLAVGDLLPEMPLFLTPDFYVSVPLDTTYRAAWNDMPGYWCEMLEQ